MSKRSGSVKDSDAPSKEENGGEESRVGSRQSKRNANKVVLYNDDYSDDDILPPKKGKRSRKRDSEDSNFSDSADDGKSKKKRRRSKKKKAKEVEEVEDTNSEEEDSSEAKSSTKKSKAKEKTKKQADGKKEKPEKVPNKTDTDYESIDFSSDKTTTDGKPWNFKISSWNVGGLKGLIKKNGLEFLKHEDPDIFCMQETKCSEAKVPEEAKVEGYHTYWVSGEKEGYAGVGVFTKQEPINVKYGLGNEEFDDEGRLITAEFEKFYLVAIYVPNAGRGLVNLPKRMKWDPDLRKYLKDLEAKKPIILCGDMNVAHEAIDLANPKTNTKNAGFTQEERDGMTALLNEGFIDSFRQLYPDKTGAYTFWTYMANARSRNIGWRLDYFILSKELLPNLCDSIIRSEVYGSDHCPITLLLHI